jgi:glycine/serine hydroxymethyltransferase
MVSFQAIVLAPFYFSHQMSLQMVGASVSICSFDTATMCPDWDALEEMAAKAKPKVIVGMTLVGGSQKLLTAF